MSDQLTQFDFDIQQARIAQLEADLKDTQLVLMWIMSRYTLKVCITNNQAMGMAKWAEDRGLLRWNDENGVNLQLIHKLAGSGEL